MMYEESENNYQKLQEMPIEHQNMILTLLDIKAGRDFFLLLLEECNYLGISYCHKDVCGTSFNEGMRVIAIKLKNMIEEVRPGEFGRLLTEQVLIKEDSNARSKQHSRLDSSG